MNYKLTTAPVLSYTYFYERFLVDTDASGKAVGAVLAHNKLDGNFHPIQFAS